MSESRAPKLIGEALGAALHRGSHVQLIAAAGSGKTETVSQRIAMLVKEGVQPSEIVAFTFTKKAATELKSRVRRRVSELAGKEKADALGPLFVGTIHSYCLNILTKQDSKFETYTPIDEHQLAAFCLRYANLLHLPSLGSGSRIEGLKRFLSTLGAIENEGLFNETVREADEIETQAPNFETKEDGSEWFERQPLRAQFAMSVAKLSRLLELHKLLTFDQQIRLAIEVLGSETTHAEISRGVKHLIVDEYQDVNKPQESLIELLAYPRGSAEVIVVGDDDQAIYQFRGSQVENILTFKSRYSNVRQFQLNENRRSNSPIVAAAANFAETISNRNDKSMIAVKDNPIPSLAAQLDFDSESEEVRAIADAIVSLKGAGWRYRDIAILVRGGAAFGELIRALESRQIPVEAGERASIFDQDDAAFFGKVFSWLARDGWKSSAWDNERTELSLENFKEVADARFTESSGEAYSWKRLENQLRELESMVDSDSRNINLTDWSYRIARACGIHNWDVSDPVLAARLGSIARFFAIVSNYEAMMKSARKVPDQTAGQVGPPDTKSWHVRNFAWYQSYYALEKMKGFGGDTRGEALDEIATDLDAISLLTVHAAKGLEWPIVFMPSLTEKRFPSAMLGRPQKWLVPRDRFDVRKYEGELDDERRIFYVGLTRAKSWLCLTAHKQPARGNQNVLPSPFAQRLVSDPELNFGPMSVLPPAEVDDNVAGADDAIQFSFSEIAQFLSCGLSYKLRSVLEFPAVIVPQIGYGKSIHHIVRQLIESTAASGAIPDSEAVARAVDDEFFLPYASSGISENLKSSAHAIVAEFVKVHGFTFTSLVEMERPFELPISQTRTVTGRADATFDMNDGDGIQIVDYKTDAPTIDHAMQVQIYAAAAQLEGIQVAGAAIHNLKSNAQVDVPIDNDAISDTLSIVDDAISAIEARRFAPNPSKKTCKACDVAAICGHSAKTQNG